MWEEILSLESNEDDNNNNNDSREDDDIDWITKDEPEPESDETDENREEK